MKVSIITIVYNNAACIESCIQSVLSQTYPHIEHIIIDGGSNDGTQNIITPYISQLGYYCSEKDSGLYNALNKGIKAATGDVIGILHSDDLFFKPTTVETIAHTFRTTDTDLLYANGMYVERENITNVKRIYKAKPYKQRYLNFGWIPLHTTIYVKKDIFTTYGYYDESYAIASDYDISLRWFKEPAIKKHFLEDWVVKMRLGGKSTTMRLQKKKSTEDLKIINKKELLGPVTLMSKIIRKTPQYIIPRVKKY